MIKKVVQNLSSADAISPTQVSPDAMLALERLVVGRECNGFDRLTPARKAAAYAELIKLGLAYGTVTEVAGRDHPDVAVRRVSSRGRRLLRVVGRTRRGRPRGVGSQVLWAFLIIAAMLLVCLFVMFRYSAG
jgi:hypothetical protein